MAVPIPTCPRCGRTMRGGMQLSSDASHGMCRACGSQPIRWVTGRGARGAPAVWPAALPKQ